MQHSTEMTRLQPKPEGYTLEFSAEAGRGVDSSGGFEDVLIVGGGRSTGVGVVGEGGGDDFGAETYIACRTEGANESAVDSVMVIEGYRLCETGEMRIMWKR